MTWVSVVGALLIVVSAPLVAVAAPPRESVANTLAAQGKLVCHRTLRATSWLQTTMNGTGWNLREADQDGSDLLLCGHRSPEGFTELWAQLPVSVYPGINNLPAVQAAGHYGSFFVGWAPFLPSLVQSKGRFGWRIYRWNSNNFLCGRVKFMQIGAFWGAMGPPNQERIKYGPTTDFIPNSETINHREKWWRWEEYFDDFYNVTQRTIYLKNLTTGIETSLTINCCPVPANPTGGGCGPSTKRCSGFWDVGGYPAPVETPHEYRDREDDGLGCVTRFMYLVVAKNLAPSERIPVSIELEGGIPSVPLNTPTNLRGCRGLPCTPASVVPLEPLLDYATQALAWLWRQWR